MKKVIYTFLTCISLLAASEFASANQQIATLDKSNISFLPVAWSSNGLKEVISINNRSNTVQFVQIVVNSGNIKIMGNYYGQSCIESAVPTHGSIICSLQPNDEIHFNSTNQSAAEGSYQVEPKQ